MGQPAYDFEQFEVSHRERQFKAVQGGGQAASSKEARAALRRQKAEQRRMIAAIIVLLGMVVCYLSFQARLTQLSGQLQAEQRNLTALKSECDYLQGKLEGISTMKNVEEIAVEQLGMTKLDASQVTYITLENQDNIICAQSGVELFFSGIKSTALSLWGDLG